MSVLYYFRFKILKYRNNTGLAYFTVFNKTVYVPNLLLSNVSFYAQVIYSYVLRQVIYSYGIALAWEISQFLLSNKCFFVNKDYLQSRNHLSLCWMVKMSRKKRS